MKLATDAVLSAEYEINGVHDTQAGPSVIKLERLVHVVNRKRHEYRERDGFLQRLELGQAEFRMYDAVGGNLEEVLEKSDRPGHQGPRPTKVWWTPP